MVKQIRELLRAVPARIISEQESLHRLRGYHSGSRDLPSAKRTLLITRNRGKFFKRLENPDAVFDPDRARSYRFELFQGCPMDCRYCFCQSYLQCQHTVIHANLDDARDEWIQDTQMSICVTGDISDSLCLAETSVPVYRKLENLFSSVMWELRTKLPFPHSWDLSPSRFLLGWSLGPAHSISVNEPGTATLNRRLADISRMLELGYTCRIRLDPIQPAGGDYQGYRQLFQSMKRLFRGNTPDMFILGSYKFSPDLLETVRNRFPGSSLIREEWTRSADGKLRPFRSVRLAAYRQVISLIKRFFPGVSVRLSMEPQWVWDVLDLCDSNI